MKEDKLFDNHRFTLLDEFVYSAERDRIISDYQNTFYFNELPLNTIKDFKNAFMPTKWSIRSFIEYYDRIPTKQRLDFLRYTVLLLDTNNHSRSKEITTFIKKVSRHFHNQFKVLKNDPISEGLSAPYEKITISSGHKEIMNTILDQFEAGYFECSLNQLVNQLTNCFDFGRHSTTVKDNFYRLHKKRQNNH